MSIPGSATPLLLATTAAGPAAAYQIDRSLRFNSADSASLTKTFSSNGDRQKWTLSFWVKRSTLGTKQQIFGSQGTNDTDYAEMYFDTDDKLFIRFGYTSVVDAKPAAVFRDVGAWMHIVIALDTQNSTANNRLRVYVNGTELSDYTDDSRSNYTGTYGIGRGGAHKISGEPNGSGSEINGYLAEIHYVNGSQLAGSDFAEYDDNSNWNPKAYSGTYGTNGFYLDFADPADLGDDNSGNNNDWTPNNLVGSAGLETAAQGFDVVKYTGNGGTNTVTGLSFQPDFVWIKNRTDSTSHMLFDSVRGVQTVLYSNATTQEQSANISVTSYNSNGFTVGSANEVNGNNDNIIAWAWNAGANSNKTYTVKVVSDSGNKYRFDDFGTSAVTLDLQEGSTYVFDQSDSSNAGHPIRFGTSANGTDYTTGVTHTGTPGSTGAKTTIIVDSAADYSSFMSESSTSGNLFDGSLSTFYGPSGNTCTFIPSSPITVSTSLEIWFKSSSASRDFEVNDSGTTINTGTSATGKWVDLNFTGSLTKISGTNGWNVAAIRVDGVILQDNAGAPTLYYSCANHSGMGGQINTNSTAGASNFDGSIKANVKANAEHGFSIVTWSGTSANATIGHGLNAAVKWIILKRRDSSSTGMYVYHSAVSPTKTLYLYGTTAAETYAAAYNNTAPTNSVFSVGSAAATNSGNMLAYCWSEVSGFSKFGSYTGDGSTKTITTGFKPKFILSKSHDTGSNWHLLDSERGSAWLEANGSGAENTNSNIVITYLDDGFTVNGSNVNNSGTGYLYMAFADTPDGSIIDSLIDTPTNYNASSGNNGGNYATLNPLDSGSGVTLSNGNLQFSSTGSSQTVREAQGTIAMPASGKYYFEVTVGTVGELNIGLKNKVSGNLSVYYRYNANNFNNVYINGSNNNRIDSYTDGDVIGVAYDSDDQEIRFYKNGTALGSEYSLTNNGQLVPHVSHGSSSGSASGHINFGQRPFAYALPTGYVSLCTQNLPDPTIADGSTAFDIALWAGTGSSNAITGLNTAPDLAWIKSRNSTGHHTLVDAVRGPTKALFSNRNVGEVTDAGYLSSFDSNGFTVVSDNDVNGSGYNYVGWAFDGGSSTVANTDGSITSNVRANASAGFSIVTWTGTSSNETVGHGLNAAPGLIIAKARNEATFWPVYHSSLGRGGYLALDETYANDTNYSDYWGDAEPTNAVFGIKGNSGNNRSGKNMLAYCFAPVAGYSAFGSYSGSGSNDGNFIFTGFAVRWLLIKCTSASGQEWVIIDSARSPFNVADEALYANDSAAEAVDSTRDVDLLSNGFKLRNGSSGATDFSGRTYIYAAFAQHPLRTARAR